MMIRATILCGGAFLAFVLIVVVGRILRRTRPKTLADVQLHTDFSIADLHALHRAGKLSDEEFEKAKLSVLARIQDHSTGHGFAVIQTTAEDRAAP